MNHEKIMEGIIQKLTGNNEEDVKFLMNECEKYKAHEYSNEIITAIMRLIYDILPEDEKDKINQITNNQNIGLKKVIKEINFHVSQRNFDKALEIIKSLIIKIENSGLFINDDKSEYYCFNNLLEEIIFKEAFKPKKEILQIPENYAEIYFSYGNILFEVERYDEAKIALEKAIRYNPVKTEYLFELGELYKIKKDWNVFLRINGDCLKYAYTGKSIARCYRNLGYFYFEEEKYELAAALYFLSIYFDKEDMVAYSELDFISKKTGLEVKPLDSQSLLKLLKDNNIQFGANNFILSIAYSIGQEAQKNNHNDTAEYYYNIVFDLTKDNEVKELIDKLSVDNR
jgi:tetratricopeptide (TPR) repeat protein